MPCCLTLVPAGDDVRRKRILTALADAGCTVRHSSSFCELPRDAGRIHPDIIVVAFGASDASAALLAVDELHAADRRLPVVFVTPDSSEATVIAALRAGVKDYLREPFDSAALAEAVRRCVTAAALRRPSEGPANAGADEREQPFIGKSRSIRGIVDQLGRLAQHDATVLITGETGTGKELVAERIHNQNAKRGGRFVSVNCAAIPDSLLESELFGYESGAFTGAVRPREGLLQLANRGTVFLDEIGDLGPLAQAKILRAIETREVYRVGGRKPEKLDVRVVAATNRDLERAVEDGSFRKDLYFRLNVARIHLPPLRERRSDILPLLDHYLQSLNRRRALKVDGFRAEAIAALEAYDWPGNVRELKNLIEAIFVCPPARQVGLADLPEDFQRRLKQVCSLPDAERRRLMEALFAAKWNKSRAATLLHCSRMTLYRKMAKYSVVSGDAARTPVSHVAVTAPRDKTPS